MLFEACANQDNHLLGIEAKNCGLAKKSRPGSRIFIFFIVRMNIFC